MSKKDVISTIIFMVVLAAIAMAMLANRYAAQNPLTDEISTVKHEYIRFNDAFVTDDNKISSKYYIVSRHNYKCKDGILYDRELGVLFDAELGLALSRNAPFECDTIMMTDAIYEVYLAESKQDDKF